MAELAIRKVCVIGAGTMGGGIAAHLTNLGFQVSLLDVNQQAVLNGLDRLRQARPPAFYLPDRSSDIRVGNVQEHLHWVSDADWVCEAVVERVDVKQSLLAKIDPLLRADAILSTNTSGIEISTLDQALSESTRRRFMGTHFFNPPRYLKLLELIPAPTTDPAIVAAMTDFLQMRVARRVILAKDSPGFIANRYGMWSLFHAIRVAEKLHLAVEDVDAITGLFMGRPKSGTFRLSDIIGLDVMRDIAQHLVERCSDDTQSKTLELTGSLYSLLARGWIGDKAGHGYYRREGKELFTLDLTTLAYRNNREPSLPDLERLSKLPLGERLKQGLECRSEVGEYLREYLPASLRYAEAIKGEISHSVLDFDRVMMWGFGWEMGPFATIDAIGAEKLGVAASGPYYKDHSMRRFTGGYEEIVDEPEFRPLQSYPQIGGGETYVLRDLGDGVTAICLTTKMGVISPKVMDELIALLAGKLGRCVLTSEAKAFSAGFDLNFFNSAILSNDLVQIENAIKGLQQLGERLEEHPSVAAIYGHCLGAGLELALSCPIIVAAAETQIGLPEAKVGLIPGGRGVTLMRLHNSHTTKRLCEITMTMTSGTIAPNVEVARQLGYLRPNDITIYNQDRLISVAKRAALEATALQRPAWTAAVGPLVGMIDKAVADSVANGTLTEYDSQIGTRLRQTIAKATSYHDSLERERFEFLDLCSKSLTHARIKHMVETNKPLRN